MKKWLAVFIILGIYIQSYSIDSTSFSTAESHLANELKNEVFHRLIDFKNSHQSFSDACKINKKEAELIPLFLEERLTFKRVEFLLSYLDNPLSKRINGPNIVSNEYDLLAPNEENMPHGLQVMEDLLYNPDENSYKQLIRENELLAELIEFIIKRNKKYAISNPHSYNLIIWDAIRYEIYRIESLGITGFDVPNSKNAIPESQSALQSLADLLPIFKDWFHIHQQKKAYKNGIKLFYQAIKYTKDHQDFDAFDRMTFMKSYLHPISTWLEQMSYDIQLEFPSNHRPLDIHAKHLFDSNILNQAFFASFSNENKIKLGEKLFYDSTLSLNNNRSCATCHIPNKGFSDGLKTHESLKGGSLERNTPTLWNAAFQTKQFYDSKALNLERQHFIVITSPTEMGGDFDSIIYRLNQFESYQKLFQLTYQGQITKINIIQAIASYVYSLKSFNSKFDQHLRSKNDILSPEEIQGFNLFAGKAQCATCHFMPLFNGLVAPTYTETESEIIGVPIDSHSPKILDKDMGKYAVTKLPIHKNAFKTPSIRNIELTAPYMHNGIYQSLEEVMEFYNNGGGLGQGMNIPNQTLAADSLHLTQEEQQAIIAFMKSLTDEAQYGISASK